MTVKVHNYYLGEENLKGIYIDGNIAINTSVDNGAEKACVLAEELGHYYTTVGDITDLSDFQNRKQERQARLWGYNKLIGLTGIIQAFRAGCHSRHETAEYLGVTEQFFTGMYRLLHGKIRRICEDRQLHYLLHSESGSHGRGITAAAII